MTRLLVLGMLDIQPMSGYDIQLMLKMNNAEHWGGVLIGSIYHALNKMEKEGLIEITSIEQTGHRQKAIYKITPTGEEHLEELVKEHLGALSVQYPSSLYSALSFIDKIPAEEAIKILDEQKEKLNAEAEFIRYGLNAKKKAMQNSVPPITYFIFENMFELIRVQKEFVEKLITHMKNK